MTTTRCNAGERKRFATEPALGSLEERLAIIWRRHGGRELPRLTAARRAELIAQYGVTAEPTERRAA